MDEAYGRKEWRTDEAAARTEAIRRIRAARDSGADTLDLSDLAALSALPEQLAELPGLQRLFAGIRRPDGKTLFYSPRRLSDVAAFRHLTALSTLDLCRTRVADLAPLASITGLTTLDLSSTPLADLAPLEPLTALTKLDLSRTRVADLAPLAAMFSLSSLDVSGTQVADLTPLTSLISLTKLNLSFTHVADLSVLLALPKFATERGRYLSFRGTPAADPAKDRRMDMLSRLPPDRCAIETVQYLKGTHPDFRDPPGGKAPAPLAARLAEASPVAVAVQDGQLTVVNAGEPERLAPRELVTRLQALRSHAAALCDEARLFNLPDYQRARFERYRAALDGDEPTYLLLDAPMAALRGAVADRYITEALDGGFVASWRELVRMHDDLRPLLLPPDELDKAPDVVPDLTPDTAIATTDKAISVLAEAAEDGLVRDAIVDTLRAATSYFELAKENASTRPSLLKRGMVVLGTIVLAIGGGVAGFPLWVGEIADAALKVQELLATPAGQALVAAMRAIWDTVKTFFI